MFAETLERIDASSFSKYQRLLAYLQSAKSGWTLDDPADRVVVFSERLETLRWLHGQCKRDLRLRDQQLTLMHGQLSDTEQQDIIERFGRLEDPLRLLLCSDVASEGLNLHYFCHRLIHFDLPWSLMVFQQRNGRVDRYGQAQEPHILYLFTATQVEKISGDLRILEILQQKDEQANLNLGDPALFLNVYDPDKEVQKVGEFMANGYDAGPGIGDAGRPAGQCAGQRGRLAAAIIRRWCGDPGTGAGPHPPEQRPHRSLARPLQRRI